RGMDFMTDIRDWLGGWPTEFSSVPEVANFAKNNFALSLVNLRVGEANSEFLLVPSNQVSTSGYTPVNLKGHYAGLSVLENAGQLSGQSVWIFGAARGGDLMFKYLSKHGVPVAGFIDIEPLSGTFHGLPVLRVDDFARQHPKTTPIILSNRYVVE